MDSMKQIQVEMSCVKFNEVSTVEVNVFDIEELENSITAQLVVELKLGKGRTKNLHRHKL